MASGTIKNYANNSGANYCKMPDGTLIQWGDDTIPSGTDKTAVTFPLSFVNSDYSISAIATYVTAKDVCFVYAAQTATAIDVYHSASITSPIPFKWVAIGRWK